MKGKVAAGAFAQALLLFVVVVVVVVVRSRRGVERNCGKFARQCVRGAGRTHQTYSVHTSSTLLLKVNISIVRAGRFFK